MKLQRFRVYVNVRAVDGRSGVMLGACGADQPVVAEFDATTADIVAAALRANIKALRDPRLKHPETIDQ